MSGNVLVVSETIKNAIIGVLEDHMEDGRIETLQEKIHVIGLEHACSIVNKVNDIIYEQTGKMVNL